MEILDNEIDIYLSPDEHEWEVFIGANASYYIPIWRKFQKQDTKVHFHFPALFLHIYWLSYRKMYKYALIGVLFPHFVNFIIIILLGIDSYWETVLISYSFYPFFGLFSNWIYYNHAQKTITQIKRTHPTEASRFSTLVEVGQTNIAAPFILLFVSTFTGILMSSMLLFFY
ncbi:DUF2628 domain-containing protein [Aureispira sp. CCB-QB1]|uniref:DUF2628 domain-containing protein n=1 Tax=Aureispira sp. CCB-QB1 TaxID=1313421 RepID=UPI000695A565|nr:DUF2628 domain-containing protein [Aureispira sp. CCB-QB1]